MAPKTQTLKLRVTTQEKTAFQYHAKSEHQNESACLRTILSPYIKLETSNVSDLKPPALKTHTLKTRITDSEKMALNQRLEQENVTPSFFLSRLIRHELNAPRYLNPHEIKAINQARKELNAIGRNLNQLVTSLHSGDPHSLTKINDRYLDRLREYINTLALSLGDYLGENFARKIKKDGDPS